MKFLHLHRAGRPACAAGSALLLLSAVSLAQVQPNSPEASLLLNGQSGLMNAPQGAIINSVVAGAPGRMVFLFTGGYADPGLPTIAGHLNISPFLGFFVNGLSDPFAVTDAGGQYLKTDQIPWLAPPGAVFSVQGAVEDPLGQAGITLTAPASITVGATTVQPAHLFFDPLTGAKGVDNHVPPAGTLAGDLPTLTQWGFEGPTAVYSGRDPVHGVFQTPFYCYTCHGNVAELYPAYMGTMMANATRDPLFKGQFAIAVAGMNMMQQSGVSWIGGALTADFCIRCHSVNGWHSGRSGFEGDGTTSAFTPGLFDDQHALDQEGVVCDFCHRATGFEGNRSPSAFAVPGQPDSGQLVLAPILTKRGPFPGTTSNVFPGGVTAYGSHVPPASTTTEPPVPHNPPLQEGTSISPGHDTEHEPFIRSATLCGSCHNVTNPATGHAVERTYTEWLNSSYGNPQDPQARTCQECHMAEVHNKPACAVAGTDPVYGDFNKVRGTIRKHLLAGGNAWIPQILKLLYPNMDLNWSSGTNYSQSSFYGPPDRGPYFDNATAAAYDMMRSAAEIDLTAIEPVPGTITAAVKITNLSGHKLPTGYPEGRRMWIRLDAADAMGAPVFQTGLLDANNELIHDPAVKVYEAVHGLDYPSLGLSGPSFHFILNNRTVKDNRILPRGAVQVRGLGGTDSYHPVLAPQGGLYPDGQNWDVTTYSIAVPATAARPIRVTATVFYQTASFEYVDFLANGGDSVVQTVPHPDAVTLRNLWLGGHPAPAMPVGQVGPTSTPDPSSPYANQTALAVVP